MMLYNIHFHLHNYFNYQCNFLLKKLHQNQIDTRNTTYTVFLSNIYYIYNVKLVLEVY